jgi:hypothetical protein
MYEEDPIDHLLFPYSLFGSIPGRGKDSSFGASQPLWAPSPVILVI